MGKRLRSTPSIVWLGPVTDDVTMMKRVAVASASNRWQLGLLRALETRGVQVTVLCHIPEPLWPRGQLFMSNDCGKLAPGIRGQVVEYWNAPLWRRRGLSGQYIAAFQRLCQTQGLPSVVLSYNDEPWNVAVGEYAQTRLGIPWVCVIADGPGPGPGFAEHEKRINRAAGRVFLSWGRFRDSKADPRFHLDGGVDTLRFSEDEVDRAYNGSIPAALFTGSMGPWAGSSLLVESFRHIGSRRSELWLCGKGSNRDVEQAARIDSRIKLLGLVEEERLQQLSRQATVFVNPREPSIPANYSNFPSKVLEYLSYGKPVISTWTDGLSPEYREVLVVVEGESPLNLAAKIEEALLWDDRQRDAYATRVSLFLKSRKLWTIQADGLLEWLEAERLIQTRKDTRIPPSPEASQFHRELVRRAPEGPSGDERGWRS